MQEVTFNVETITPLFLAGADQGTAELRAPRFVELCATGSEH